MGRKVMLVAGTTQTKGALLKQLQEYIGDYITLVGYSIEDDEPCKIEGDLIILSSDILYQEYLSLFDTVSKDKIIIARRSINFMAIEKLLKIPTGTQVLCVNDCKVSAAECVEQLIELGIDHIEYHAYYPEIGEIALCTLVITPGEVKMVPKENSGEIINIGPRLIDISTMAEILDRLGLLEEKAKDLSNRYLKKIIALSKDMIHMEKVLKHRLVKKGHVGKYQFDHIIGNSVETLETKKLASKLAKSELNILIEGESGTGKELFASAIHNASLRKDGPFLGVNFSALPETLVESELFGYEEGAFTGAVKGGKKGLFEMAEGGTIFLDEIGDISPKIQARLLRVLQEKEIMRVGGSNIIKVDVRVISATNKNLLDMIAQEKFRQDLYHRLKVLYLKLLPLRSKKQDINDLISHLLSQREEVHMEESVWTTLRDHHWYGNVRELKNTIDYMLAVCEDGCITMKDIPQMDFFEKKIQKNEEQSPQDYELEQLADVKEIGFILHCLYQNSSGRKEIAKKAEQEGLLLTETMIRHRLKHLEEKGYVVSGKGRSGTRLTQKGKKAIEEILAR